MSGNLREILGNGEPLLVDDIQLGLGSRAGGKVYFENAWRGAPPVGPADKSAEEAKTPAVKSSKKTPTGKK